MADLKISLLGQPRLLLDGAPYQTHSTRMVALLAYLALEEKPCSRAALLSLLWPRRQDDQSPGALRTLLWRLRDTPLVDWLKISDEEVCLSSDRPIQVDVLDFQHLLDECSASPRHSATQACRFCQPHLTQAAALYQGDFMQGHQLTGAERFHNWQTTWRESLRQQVLSVYQRLVEYHNQLGQPQQAIPYAQRWLEFDPSDESIHQLLMRLYASSGQRQAALAQYQRCQKAIARAYDNTPSMETNLLYNQIRGAGGQILPPLPQPVLVLISLENAVQLWSQEPQSFHAKAERLLKITKRCVRNHAGQIIKYDKDHAIILFTEGRPLHFALDLQRQITEEPWGSVFAPLLCTSIFAIQQDTALHKGHPKVDAASLQPLYAIVQAAWPGQVLVNEQAARLLTLPRQGRIQDHGTHLLKGLKDPVHVLEFTHPDLSENQARPIRSLSQRQHNLPTPPTRLVGREQEREQIRRMLSQPDCRLLTLAGPGGIGKTRLALESAREVLKEYPDGVYFAPLAATKYARHIPTVLADALGLRYNAQQDNFAQVANYLRTKHCLLVLDNLEHLLEGSEILSDLLTQSPHLKILATSRERLNLQPETVYEIGGLPYPESPCQPGDCEHLPAIQLFLQSAGRALSTFQADAETLTHIVKICRLVNGIPLAIELAAAWVRTLTCAEIAARIEGNLDFLASSLRDLPERQRSLRAVFEHSWNLLSEEERRVLARLCRFRGGFSAQAAARVADATALTLTALADKSMLQVTQEGRYDMLDVLRHYAAEKLKGYPGEPDTTRERHAHHYAAQLAQMIFDLNTHQQAQALATFRLEYENIRLAWNWALQHTRWDALDQMQAAMYQYHDMVGRYADGQAVFTRAVQTLQAQASPEHQGVLAKLRMWQGWFAFRLGSQEEGLLEMEQALGVFRQNGLLWEHTFTLNYLAEAYLMLRRIDLALERVEESQRVYPCNDPPSDPQQALQSGYVNYLMGSIYFQQGYPNRARPLLEKSLQTVQSLGSQWAAVRVLNALARVWELLENHQETLVIRQRMLEICEELGDRRGMASTLNNLASTYEEMQDHEKATQALQQALEIAREVGDRRLAAIILLNLASDHRSIYHTPDQAIPLAQEALQTFEEIGDQGGTVYAAYDLAGAYLEAGKINQAYGAYCQALYNASETAGWRLHVLHGFASYYAHTGNLVEAIKLCALILAHPASEIDARDRAAKLLSTIEDRLPPKKASEIRQAGRLLTLDEACVQVLVADPNRGKGFSDSEENPFGP